MLKNGSLCLTFCAKAKKSLEPNSRKPSDQLLTDQPTNYYFLSSSSTDGQVDSGNIGNMGNTGNVGLPILPILTILPESISPILQNETGNIGNMGNMGKPTLPILPILPVLSFSFLGIASILDTQQLNS